MKISEICLKEYNKGYWNYYVSDPNYFEKVPLTPKNMPYELKDLFDPKINKKIGSWYLRELYLRYKCETIEEILCAYNWGIGNLRKKGIKKAPRETRQYVRKVLKLYNE